MKELLIYLIAMGGFAAFAYAGFKWMTGTPLPKAVRIPPPKADPNAPKLDQRARRRAMYIGYAIWALSFCAVLSLMNSADSMLARFSDGTRIWGLLILFVLGMFIPRLSDMAYGLFLTPAERKVVQKDYIRLVKASIPILEVIVRITFPFFVLLIAGFVYLAAMGVYELYHDTVSDPITQVEVPAPMDAEAARQERLERVLDMGGRPADADQGRENVDPRLTR